MDHRTDSPAWLATLLAPVAVEDFLSDYWLKRHLFCRGPADRFSPLLSWDTLNTTLAHHWRETFRFRLALQGRDLDPASYADLDGYTPRIRAKDVTDHLRRGATLSFDAIDELHEPLTQLAESFESFFRGGTKINIYAGWRALHGLDLHRDNQEIFILQLDGRKRWLLYGFSIDGIDRSGLRDSSAPPQGAELDQVLQPGDLLYIPRGCYHVALPMNEPTLHLTLGVKNPRGADLLQWIVARLQPSELAARDLPFLAPAAERLDYAERLRASLVDGLSRDLVEQYFAETGSNLKPRPSFSLPWSATPELVPPGDGFLVGLSTRVRLCDESAAGFCEIHAGSRALRFPRIMQSVAALLLERSPRTFRELVDGNGGGLDAEAVRLLVGLLVKEGLAEIRS